MLRRLRNIFDLGVKEFHTILRDPVLLLLIAWAFTMGIITPGKGAGQASLQNARIAMVDEDGSVLSHRIAASLYPPYFVPPPQISFATVDRLMDEGEFTFVLVVPAGFERDLIAGKAPKLQLLVDATRMKQAGIGAGYVDNIVNGQIAEFLQGKRQEARPPVDLVVRTKFNPNLIPSGFQGLVVLINNTTLLTILLTGAAVIREREHGTIEHALAMPITAFELMVGKIWANALVMVMVILASLFLVVRGLLNLTIAGSLSLLILAVLAYLFCVTSIGILLATLSRSMPQLGLLAIMVVVPMNMLSGNNTPIESQPPVLQAVMQLSPSTHFVAVAQAIVFRGAGLADIWIRMALTVGIGTTLFVMAMLRFRRSMAAAQS